MDTSKITDIRAYGRYFRKLCSIPAQQAIDAKDAFRLKGYLHPGVFGGMLHDARAQLARAAARARVLADLKRQLAAAFARQPINGFYSAVSWLRHASRAIPPFQLPNVLHCRKTRDEMNHETHEAHETGNHAKDFQRKDAKVQIR